MDKETFGALIMKNEQQLYRIAKSILKNDDDCADAAQEAVVKGFANLYTLRNDRYAMTWLIRILINECYSIRKKNAKNLPLDMGLYGETFDDRRDYSDLYEALSHLPDELRIVLVLHYLEGYAIKEIADILQLPGGTVKSRMSRGRYQLRQLLEEVS